MHTLPQASDALPVGRNLLRWRRLGVQEMPMTEPATAATVLHGIAAGAPQWGGALVHIHRRETHSSAYCGVVLRQRWMAKEGTMPVTCKKCIREEAKGG